MKRHHPAGRNLQKSDIVGFVDVSIVNITLCLKTYIFHGDVITIDVLRAFILTKFGSIQVLSKLLYRVGERVEIER